MTQYAPTVLLGAGYFPDGKSKPRRRATLLREVACPTTGQKTGHWFIVRYQDTGEEALTYRELAPC